MNKLFALAFAALLLAGCDKVVSTSPSGEAFKRSESQACSAGPGYCFACGLGFDGKYNCGIGFKFDCPGSQDVTVEVQPVIKTYESGKREMSEVSSVVSIDSDCR